MKLTDLGYNQQIEKFRTDNGLADFDIGRVISEHKERYVVKTETGETEAEITGNMRFTAKSREDFPAVGDWVALTVYDSYLSIIHQIDLQLFRDRQLASSVRYRLLQQTLIMLSWCRLSTGITVSTGSKDI